MKKEFLKRFLAVALAILIVVPGVAANVLASGLGGYDGHWSADSVDRWVGEGLIQGDGSGSLDPDGTLTRGHVATIIARLLRLEKKADISNIVDVTADAWYADGIAKCVQTGIFTGTGENTMEPERVLTRAEFFTVVSRMLGLGESESADRTFKDSDSVQAYAAGYINTLVNMGVIQGTPAGKLDPDGKITYAAMSTVLDRLIGTYADEEGEHSVSGTGVTLVVAGNVTLKGEASEWPIVVASDGANVDMSGITGKATVNVMGDNVTATGAAVGTVFNVNGAEGLSVNGVKPGDVATYVVPAPSTPGSSGAPVIPDEPDEPDEPELNEYGLTSQIEDGTILHAWCWNFNTIKEMIPYIAAAGFSAVQTSPINTILVGENGGLNIVGSGKWYYHYQPTEYEVIGNYQLGTAEEFEEMCEVAHQYGVKVIVDQVLNHMTASRDAISENIRNGDWGDPGVMGDPENPWTHKNSGTNWSEGDRYEETQNSLSGLVEWNTQNPRVQEYLRTWLETCVAAGADGFRYDAAKLIELPDDTSDKHDVDFASEFWPNVLQNGASFQYGEVLQEGEPNHPHSGVPTVRSGYDDNDSSRLYAYQSQTFTTADGEEKHFNTTLSFYGWRIRDAVSSGNLNADYVGDMLVPAGASADRTVTWVESHDNYMNDASYNVLDEQQVIEAWAIIASRKDGTPLFFSRPMNATAGSPYGNNEIGPEGSHFFMDSQVVAVNFFHNEMGDAEEYLSNPTGSDKVVMIERGDAGAVIVNAMDEDLVLNGAPVQNMADGTYTDQAYGGTFTVKDGKISGTVKAGKVAVVYNSKVDSSLEFEPEITLSVPTSDFLTETLDVSVSIRGVDHATYRLDDGEEQPVNNGDTITVGEGLAKDQSVTLTVTGYDEAGEKLAEASAAYTKKEYRADTIVYVHDAVRESRGWSQIYIYIWNTVDGATVQNQSWPGVRAELQTEGEWAGYWKYVLPFSLENLEGNHVIVHGNASGKIERADMLIGPGEIKVMLADESWVDPDEAARPTVSAAPGTSDFNTDNITVTLYASNVTRATYTLGDGAETDYKDGDTITFGETLTKNGETITLKLRGYTDDEPVTAEYTYTKRLYEGTSAIYVDPAVVPAGWTNGVWVYLYDSANSNHGYNWPGVQITEEKNGYLVYKLPDDLQGGTYTVIFNNNGGDSGNQQVEMGWKIGPDEQKLWTTSEDSDKGRWVDYVAQSFVYVADGYLEANSWDTVYTYIWGDHENHPWPGVAMEKVEEGDWAGYRKYELPAADYEGTTNNNVILNNSGSGTGNQNNAGTMVWGDTKVMTADGRWIDAYELTSANVSATPGDKTEFYAEELEVTLRATNVTDAAYQVDDGEKIPYEDGDTVKIGKDAADGAEIVLTLTGKSAGGADVTAKLTYTKHYHADVEPRSVLFIGNSYTYYNDGVWTHFQKLAYEAGYNAEVDSVTIGSHHLYEFADPNEADANGGPLVEKKLSENKYDIVFLQEHSTYPITNYQAFEDAVRKLNDRIKVMNPEARVILYQTWGRNSASADLTSNGRGWTNETMTYDLLHAYAKAAKEVGTEISNVGTAFHDVYSNHGTEIDMYDADLTHPKLPGTYLASLVHFITVFGDEKVDDAVKYTAGLDKNTVGILKEAALAAPEKSAEPHVYVTPVAEGSTVITGDVLTVTLHAVNVDSAVYTIDGGEEVDYTHGDTVEIGKDVPAGGTVTVRVKGTAGDTAVEAGCEYTRKNYSGTTTIYIDPAVRPEWTNYSIYMYGGNGNPNSTWPGVQQADLTEEDGLLVYHLPKSMQEQTWTVIFSNGGDNSDQVEKRWTIGPDEQKIWTLDEDGADVWEKYDVPARIYIDPAVRPDWTDICVYMYGDGTGNPGWPGFHQSEMKEENGLLVLRLPDEMQGSTWTVIFSNNGDGGTQVERGWKIGPGEQKFWADDGSSFGAWQDYGAEEPEIEEHYLVIGWYAKTATSGLDETNVATFIDELKEYLKSEHNATDEELADIVVNAYDGNVADMGALVRADGNVDIMIGVGENVDQPTSPGGPTADIPIKEKTGGIYIGESGKSRWIARLTDKELAIAVYNWIKENYNTAP